MVTWVALLILFPLVSAAPIVPEFVPPEIVVTQDPLSKTYKILVKTPYYEKHEEILADGTILGDCLFNINEELKSISYIVSKESFYFLGDIHSKIKKGNSIENSYVSKAPWNKEKIDLETPSEAVREEEADDDDEGGEDEAIFQIRQTSNEESGIYRVHSLQGPSNLPNGLRFELPYPLQTYRIGTGHHTVPIHHTNKIVVPTDLHNKIPDDIFTELHFKSNNVIVIDDLEQDTESKISSETTEPVAQKEKYNSKGDEGILKNKEYKEAVKNKVFEGTTTANKHDIDENQNSTNEEISNDKDEEAIVENKVLEGTTTEDGHDLEKNENENSTPPHSTIKVNTVNPVNPDIEEEKSLNTESSSDQNVSEAVTMPDVGAHLKQHIAEDGASSTEKVLVINVSDVESISGLEFVQEPDSHKSYVEQQNTK